MPAPCYRMHSSANIYFHQSCGRDSHNAVDHACVLGQGDYQTNFDSAKCSQSSLPCPTVSTLLLVEVVSSKSKGAITKSSHLPNMGTAVSCIKRSRQDSQQTTKHHHHIIIAKQSVQWPVDHSGIREDHFQGNIQNNDEGQ